MISRSKRGILYGASIMIILINTFFFSLAANAQTDLDILLQDDDIQYADLEKFSASLPEESSFYAVHLNGSENYPALLKNDSVSELSEDSNKASMSLEEIKKIYPDIEAAYTLAIHQDTKGERFLFLLGNQGKTIGSDENEPGGNYSVLKILITIVSVLVLVLGFIYMIIKWRKPSTGRIIVDPPFPDPPDTVPTNETIYVLGEAYKVENLINSDVATEREKLIRHIEDVLAENNIHMDTKFTFIQSELTIFEQQGKMVVKFAEGLENKGKLKQLYLEKIQDALKTIREITDFKDPEEKLNECIENIHKYYRKLGEIFLEMLHLQTQIEGVERTGLLSDLIEYEMKYSSVIQEDLSNELAGVIKELKGLKQTVENQGEKLESLHVEFLTTKEKQQKQYEEQIEKQFELITDLQNVQAKEMIDLRQHVITSINRMDKQIKTLEESKDSMLTQVEAEFQTLLTAQGGKVDLKIKNQRDIIMRKIEEHYEELQQKMNDLDERIFKKLNSEMMHSGEYGRVQDDIKTKFSKWELPDDVITSLTLGRYMKVYKREVFSKDPAVIYLAYSRAVEKIGNRQEDRSFSLYNFLKGLKHSIDLLWIATTRNQAAHTGDIKWTDIEKIDQELLERNNKREYTLIQLLEVGNVHK